MSKTNSTNGFLTSLLLWSITELKLNYSDIIWHMPLTTIMLLVRQKIYNEKKSGFMLSDIEAIDNGLMKF